MKARGIKVDGVGFQAHMIVGGTPGRSSLTSLLNSFTTLGVDVACKSMIIFFLKQAYADPFYSFRHRIRCSP